MISGIRLTLIMDSRSRFAISSVVYRNPESELVTSLIRIQTHFSITFVTCIATDIFPTLHHPLIRVVVCYVRFDSEIHHILSNIAFSALLFNKLLICLFHLGLLGILSTYTSLFLSLSLNHSLTHLSTHSSINQKTERNNKELKHTASTVHVYSPNPHNNKKKHKKKSYTTKQHTTLTQKPI